MRGAKSAKWVAGAIVVALAATACGGGDDSAGDDMNKGKADPNGIVTAQLSEPQNPLQPANAKESQGSRVLRTIFAGLVDYEPGTGKLVYVNAESVTPNDDSSEWTVKLEAGLEVPRRHAGHRQVLRGLLELVGQHQEQPDQLQLVLRHRGLRGRAPGEG
ncbi:hypothetical protein STAFG_1816 [Streptomyces afghaniensis 772]|uniref:Uncharacterized protein n=1 Tax=Streptomyces afghaniensis 772 TaxID=1283301 RepID=S4NRJ1_9ACTN|nr:hypothetical protein STAFG_1816 [Streptomyces afghaniensis 772]